MFEGLVTSTSPQPSAEAGALRPVAWGDLVAKIAAARDLRELFAADSRRSLASFAPGAARALANCGQAEHHVNPEALVAGKTRGATHVSAADDARDGDREMQ